MSAAPTAPLTASAPKPVRRGAPRWLAWAGFGTVVLVVLAFALLSSSFLLPGNISAILNQAAVYAIAGFGLAVVVITGGDDVVNGGIDLSVGAVAGLAGTVAAVAAQSGTSPVAAIALALLVSLIAGAINGGAVLIGLRPLLATLAMLGIAGSLNLVISGNVKVALTGTTFAWLRDGSILGLPVAVVVMLVIFAVVGLAMSKTSWGIRSYAVGQNPTAARVAGLRPGRYIFGSYVISAGLAGVAGILLASRLSSAVPGLGEQILLDIVLVAFMSVVFSRRLVVSPGGTLVAALFVAALTNGFTLLGVASQWVGAAKGVLILIVLAVVAIRGRSTAK
ncbi:ABC transporter permease [Arthrobacter burdickii]|uniref:ABC transporter permease n=1 Tax=Arthrobacter burdickii TaxID=3035920 RepID=A0ABT8JWK5_9MICC|nr:ABC transporter permease [Arthrobacter burdickii]MDN4609540.1 ABC transporter permease [Arthrobacter burdickii]